MELLASTSVSLAIVNLVFAAIALAIGFAAGVWVYGETGKKKHLSDTPAPLPEAAEEPSIDPLALERASMASDRLRDLASGVASDVGAHNESIGKIEAELSSIRESSVDVPQKAVIRALTEISAANELLQQRLANAEEQIQSQSELIRVHESEARTDSLTQLSNRRAFDDELERRFSEWQRKSTPFSLLIGDVDHFKKFNDTHGHQAGDEVLKQVASTLKRCARGMDLPCRYGGEEFALILPATIGNDGEVIAERVRKAVEELKIGFEGKTLQVTMSLGLAQAGAGEDADGLIKRADEALYASKDAGRNRSYRHSGVEALPIPIAGKAAPDDEGENTPADSPTATLDTLANRTKFLEQLRGLVREAQDRGRTASLLTVVFNGYEKLTDEFGQSIANMTLDSVAQFLKSAMQREDLLGRLDDGQFVAYLPGKSVAETQEIGKRINEALAQCTVPLGESSLQLKTSMTATELSKSDTAASFMQRAESVLGADHSEKDTPVLV